MFACYLRWQAGTHTSAAVYIAPSILSMDAPLILLTCFWMKVFPFRKLKRKTWLPIDFRYYHACTCFMGGLHSIFTLKLAMKNGMWKIWEQNDEAKQAANVIFRIVVELKGYRLPKCEKTWIISLWMNEFWHKQDVSNKQKIILVELPLPMCVLCTLVK